MTWKRYAAFLTVVSVVFVVWFVIDLVLTLIGFMGGATPGAIGSVVLAAFVLVLSLFQRQKARRHARSGDPEPMNFADLARRL